MELNPSGILDPQSCIKLSALATGIETLQMPINEHLLLVGVVGPKQFARVEVAIAPETIILKRPGDKPQSFGIVYNTSPVPEEVLGRLVSSLTMVRYEDSWRLRQDPHRLLEVRNSEGFSLFWRLIARAVQDIRQNRQQASTGGAD